MTKKGWTRVLIVIVAGLWGYNIYRTVQNYQLKTESDERRETTPVSFAPVMFNKDSFNLALPLEDPFLKGQTWTGNSSVSNSREDKQNQRPQNPPQNRPAPQASNMKWPTVQYYGFLRNHSGNKKRCILNIDGRNYRLSAGDEEDAIRVIAAYPDSVILAFHADVKTILKN